MLRISAKKQYGRETSSGQQAIAHESLLAGKTTSNTARGSAYRRRQGNMAARLRHGQDVSINREIGHFRTASISQATLRRTETTELTAKTKLVRDPVAGLRGLLSRIALVALNPASIPLRSIAGDSDAMTSRCRDCAN